jgi:multidrug efflux pump subunit AcrA (membrane-fusion protein)
MKRILLFLMIGGVGVASIFGYLRYRALAVAQAQTTITDAPATLAVTRGTVQQTVAAPGALVGTREVALGLPVGGRIAELRVRPGEQVQAGTVLATLDPGDLQQEADQLQAEYLQAQLSYSQTIQGPDPAAVQAAQASLISCSKRNAPIRPPQIARRRSWRRRRPPTTVTPPKPPTMPPLPIPNPARCSAPRRKLPRLRRN